MEDKVREQQDERAHDRRALAISASEQAPSAGPSPAGGTKRKTGARTTTSASDEWNVYCVMDGMMPCVSLSPSATSTHNMKMKRQSNSAKTA